MQYIPLDRTVSVKYEDAFCSKANFNEALCKTCSKDHVFVNSV